MSEAARIYLMLAFAIALFVTATTFVTVPVYRECRADGHSWLYCIRLVSR